jgi:aldehyde:ferredoxin oxidoreductase
MVTNLHHVVQASGACHFILFLFMPPFSTPVQDFLNAVTGWELSADEISAIGERIATLRHAFNLREGLNPLQFKMPDRAIGVPPLDEGPLKGVKIGEEGLNTMISGYFKLMDWDMTTAKPSKKRLEELGLDDVAGDLRSI